MMFGFGKMIESLKKSPKKIVFTEGRCFGQSYVQYDFNAGER